MGFGEGDNHQRLRDYRMTNELNKPAKYSTEGSICVPEPSF